MAQQISAFKEALGDDSAERVFKELRIRYVQYDQFGIPFVVSRSETVKGDEGGTLSELVELEDELRGAGVDDEAVCKGMILGATV